MREGGGGGGLFEMFDQTTSPQEGGGVFLDV